MAARIRPRADSGRARAGCGRFPARHGASCCSRCHARPPGPRGHAPPPRVPLRPARALPALARPAAKPNAPHPEACRLALAGACSHVHPCAHSEPGRGLPNTHVCNPAAAHEGLQGKALLRSFPCPSVGVHQGPQARPVPSAGPGWTAARAAGGESSRKEKVFSLYECVPTLFLVCSYFVSPPNRPPGRMNPRFLGFVSLSHQKSTPTPG